MLIVLDVAATGWSRFYAVSILHTLSCHLMAEVMRSSGCAHIESQRLKFDVCLTLHH